MPLMMRRVLLALLIGAALTLLLLPDAVLAWRAVQVDWRALPYPAIRSAIWLSLWTTTISLITIVILGLPLSYWLARTRSRRARILRVLIQLPIVMPPAVAGLALLLTFGRGGLIDAPIAFTPFAVIIAQVFVGMPFFVRSAQVGFAAIDPDYEQAARVDGADDWALWWLITLPLARRPIIVGMLLAWARALGEFGATILFAGNLQGRTQTLPLLVYSIFEQDVGAASAIALLLLLIALSVLFLSEGLLTNDDTGAG